MQVSKRVSKDKEVHDFGMYLMNTCKQFGFHIVNGTMEMSAETLHIYIIHSVGCSVIYYFIVSRCRLFSLTMSLKVA